MAKITAEQRLDLRKWEGFAERMKWELGPVELGTPTQEPYGLFKRSDGYATRLTLTERQDIEATWREQDKPKLEVAGG